MPLSGDWGRLASMLGRASSLTTFHEARAVLREYADIVKEDAQGRLGQYQEGWAPLAESTQAERERAGYPADEPLLRTGALRDAIAVHEDADGAYLVGIPSDSDQAAVGVAQELGTLTIPPRPFLGPALEAHIAEIGEAVGKAAIGELTID